MAILKVEAFAGVSGDMFLGALLGLVKDEPSLITLPEKLGLRGVQIESAQVKRQNIVCQNVRILSNESSAERHLSEILSIIERADISQGAKEKSITIFKLLADAEAEVHGVSVNDLHFHEVGAIDSILDIVGTAVLLDRLNISKVFSTPISVGGGWVECAHGKMPVPVPAVERLLLGMPVRQGPVEVELTTPTGAAILKSLEPDFCLPSLVGLHSSHGAGSRDLQIPNFLRLSLCDYDPKTENSVFVIQTNLDDTTPELLGEALQKKLFENGALDFTLQPVHMKKSRPGWRLEVICSEEHLQKLRHCILTETSANGLRYFPVAREILPIEFKTVETPYGNIRVKIATLPDGNRRVLPEYEDCRVLAESKHSSIQEIYWSALKHCL